MECLRFLICKLSIHSLLGAVGERVGGSAEDDEDGAARHLTIFTNLTIYLHDDDYDDDNGRYGLCPSIIKSQSYRDEILLGVGTCRGDIYRLRSIKYIQLFHHASKIEIHDATFYHRNDLHLTGLHPTPPPHLLKSPSLPSISIAPASTTKRP